MRYWVYGLDRSTQMPCEPLFVEADSEEAARAQAAAEGMQVEEVEAAQLRPVAAPAKSPESEGDLSRFVETEYVLARGLVIVLRVLAVLAAVWGFVNTGAAMNAASAVEARLKGMPLEGAAAEAAGAARSAATLAVVAAAVYGVALVSILLALAEGLRLALVIERRTREAPARKNRRAP